MYIVQVKRTPPFLAAAFGKYYAQLVANLKHAGSALHNAVVDSDFVGQPETNDASVQVPPDLSPVVDHPAAIVRANALRPFILAHFRDGTYAHSAADSSNAAVITAADATDITSLSALLVQYRTALNSHFGWTVGHNRITLVPAISTVPVDSATNIQVVNTINLLLESHLYSAATSIAVEPI
jgi:hypothetical protein